VCISKEEVAVVGSGEMEKEGATITGVAVG
jgi:hypothetical protein